MYKYFKFGIYDTGTRIMAADEIMQDRICSIVAKTIGERRSLFNFLFLIKVLSALASYCLFQEEACNQCSFKIDEKQNTALLL